MRGFDHRNTAFDTFSYQFQYSDEKDPFFSVQEKKANYFMYFPLASDHTM